DNVDRCHLVLVLVRGRLAYFGPPDAASDYFRVGRLSAVYDRLAEHPPEEWERRFRESDQYRQYVQARMGEELGVRDQDSGVRGQSAELPAPSIIPDPRGLWHQFKVLTRRYIDLTLGDRRSL